MAPARKAARAPRLTPFAHDLRAADAGSGVLDEDETLEQVALGGQAPIELHAPSLTLADSRITASMAQARLPGLYVRGCEITGSDLANLHAPQGALHRTTLERVRLTGAMFAEGSLQDVRLTECRLDLASLAAAKIERVVFTDCDLRETAFDEAHLRDVRFERCDLAGTSFSRARIERVELVGCDLERVRFVSDLRGATMPWQDSVANAGPLAAAAGIGVLAADEPDA